MPATRYELIVTCMCEWTVPVGPLYKTMDCLENSYGAHTCRLWYSLTVVQVWNEWNLFSHLQVPQIRVTWLASLSSTTVLFRPYLWGSTAEVHHQQKQEVGWFLITVESARNAGSNRLVNMHEAAAFLCCQLPHWCWAGGELRQAPGSVVTTCEVYFCGFIEKVEEGGILFLWWVLHILLCSWALNYKSLLINILLIQPVNPFSSLPSPSGIS